MKKRTKTVECENNAPDNSSSVLLVYLFMAFPNHFEQNSGFVNDKNNPALTNIPKEKPPALQFA